MNGALVLKVERSVPMLLDILISVLTPWTSGARHFKRREKRLDATADVKQRVAASVDERTTLFRTSFLRFT